MSTTSALQFHLKLSHLVISICIDVSFRLYLSTHKINWCKNKEQQTKRSKLYAKYFEKGKNLAFMCDMIQLEVLKSLEFDYIIIWL